MFTRVRFISLIVLGLLPLSGTGCVVVGVPGWGWHCGGCCVWTDSTTERIPIDTVDLKAVQVRTHNGSIGFEAQPEGVDEAYVIVTKKAGGATLADAEAALEAVEVLMKRTTGGRQHIGWKWAGVRRAGWQADVSFEIKAPGTLRFEGETHNGPIEIAGITGDVTLVTHNGSVTVESSGGKLDAETHNGKVVAVYSGDDVTLVTHNGGVLADLKGCGAVGGKIATHNGSVEVVVGENTSAELTCRTHNGSIKCDAPLNNTEISRHELNGTIGTGEGELDITTHNGSVGIRKTAG